LQALYQSRVDYVWVVLKALRRVAIGLMCHSDKANLCALGAAFWSSQNVKKWAVCEVLMYSDH